MFLLWVMILKDPVEWYTLNVVAKKDRIWWIRNFTKGNKKMMHTIATLTVCGIKKKHKILIQYSYVHALWNLNLRQSFKFVYILHNQSWKFSPRTFFLWIIILLKENGKSLIYKKYIGLKIILKASTI
jgi:hypothetical protein